MGQSLSGNSQTNRDIQLFTTLGEPLHEPSNKRTPTTLKSTRSSEYRIKDFKRPFQHKKRITALYIHEPSESQNNLINATSKTESRSKGKQLWTASADKTIICWNLNTGYPQILFQGHTDTVSCLKIRDSLLYSASFDRTIRIWDLNEKHKHCIDVIQDQENWICSLELWKNFVLCAGYSKSINMYDLNTKQKVKSLTGHQKRIESMQMDDCILYTGSVDGSVRLWDLEQGGTCIRVIHARDECFRLNLWNDKFLIVGQQEDVLCLNIERDFPQTTSIQGRVQHNQAIFVGLSVYCIYDMLLIGWNRSKKRFEFWNIVNTIGNSVMETFLDQKESVRESLGNSIIRSDAGSIIDSSKNCTGESFGFRGGNSVQNDAWDTSTSFEHREKENHLKLVHVIPTDVLMCTSVYFVPGVLFYVSGTQIHTLSVHLDIDRVRDNTFTDSEQGDEREIPLKGQNESIVDLESILDVQQPAYSFYTRLFDYFTDTLLYPTARIANAIEFLHLEGKLNVPFISQVNILGEFLRVNHQQSVIDESSNRIESGIALETSGRNKELGSGQSALNFTIYLNSKEESEGQQIPEIYTKEELSLDFESRIDLFYKRLQSTTTDVIQPTVLVVRREQLVFDACKHFTQLSLEDLKRPLYIFFANEKGLDSGGLAAEFYRLIGDEILNENNALFENKGRNVYYPNPKSSVNETHLQYFKFIGRVVGKALFDMQLMNTHFSSVLFKFMVGSIVTFRDLQHVDRTLYISLRRIYDIDDIDSLQLEFAAEIDDFGRSNTYYLLNDDYEGNESDEEVENEKDEKANKKNSSKGGKQRIQKDAQKRQRDVLVTRKNKHKFIELLSRWTLIESVRYQIELFLEGVYEVIPKPYFKIFSESEVELLLCGHPNVCIEDWKEHTHLEGFEENDPAIRIFWGTVESMSPFERGKLLSFVTGTSNPPVGGFVNIHPQFCISKLHGATKDHLPQAQTCINRIAIPESYPSREWCLKKLLQAIEGGTSFEFV